MSISSPRKISKWRMLLQWEPLCSMPCSLHKHVYTAFQICSLPFVFLNSAQVNWLPFVQGWFVQCPMREYLTECFKSTINDELSMIYQIMLCYYELEIVILFAYNYSKYLVPWITIDPFPVTSLICIILYCKLGFGSILIFWWHYVFNFPSVEILVFYLFISYNFLNYKITSIFFLYLARVRRGGDVWKKMLVCLTFGCMLFVQHFKWYAHLKCIFFSIISKVRWHSKFSFDVRCAIVNFGLSIHCCSASLTPTLSLSLSRISISLSLFLYFKIYCFSLEGMTYVWFYINDTVIRK